MGYKIMKDARSNSTKCTKSTCAKTRFKTPLKVIAFITLWCFVFTNIFGEFLMERAWARESVKPTHVNTRQSDNPSLPKAFNPKTFSLPAYLGHIDDSWRPAIRQTPQAANSIVIHIQDAHCNYDAQKKIAEIIEYLNDEYGVETINLEGGAGDYDLSVFTGIKDIEPRKKAADYFVKEGLVNGAEYFAVCNPEKVKLWGVEDTRLYLTNLNTYRESLKHKDEIAKLLVSLKNALDQLKSKIYSQELFSIDQKYFACKNGEIGIKDYVSFLNSAAVKNGVALESFPNIAALSETIAREDGIDFKEANIQRGRLIDVLQRTLSKVELEELVRLTLDFKAEKISQDDFYSYLADKARSINLHPDTFPELAKFSAYIAVYDAVDKSVVSKELERLTS